MSKKWANENFATVPQNWDAGQETFSATNAMGTGPFEITLREPNTKTVFKKNKKWWGTVEHNLDEIQLSWEEDSKIDEDNLHTESTKIPSLHAKYYRILNNILLMKKLEENKFKQIKKEKWQYYTGKADPEVYIEKPFDHKVLRQDVDKYMDSDEDLIKVLNKIDYFQVMLTYLDSILKSINNRTFQIKNSIEWQKFIRGYD